MHSVATQYVSFSQSLLALQLAGVGMHWSNRHTDPIEHVPF
jgi:hypothetical protein